MERRAAASDQGTPDSEMGDADNDSVGYGTEMELDGSAGAAAYPARPSVHDGVDPFEGMEFDDEEDAWTFYNVYAHRVGFSTRISVMHRSRRDGAIMSRQFVCAKEGFRTYRGKNDGLAASPGGGGEDGGRGRRTRAVTRVGCKAMIRVKKQDNAKWMITKLETAHNHPLVPQDQSHCLRPHKPLSECGKQRATAYGGGRRNGGGMLLAIEPPPQPLTPPVPLNSIAPVVVPQYVGDGIGDAARVVLDYVKRMQAEDPAFFYAMQFVDGHPVGNVFWSDARARMAYKDFGDAVFLDDSCRRNKYEFPLVTFTGVNRHCQPILFGCAVIRDNSEASFVWLFETLLLAMSGQHPTSLTTEYDGAIHSAVRKVLHQTRHRICGWHILLNEAQYKLSHLSPSFHEELVTCINMSETIDEFEANWEALISKLDSGNNEWLDSVYKCRQQWVPVYLRDTFFGDEPSRLECTSRSSFFESYIIAKTNSQSFIQQYEKALDSCYEKEMKEEFETKYSLPDIKTSSPIEKQGADMYTRTLFLKFQQELVDASVSTLEMVEEVGRACIYKVTASQGSEKPRMVRFHSSETSAKCTCQMFEYFGIVCRHILTVFGAQGVSALPSQYILTRWTKHAIDRSSNKKLDEVGRVDRSSNKKVDEVGQVKEPKEEQKSNAEDGEQSQTWRYNNLCREALRYAEEGASSVDVYIVAMHALQEAANKVNLAKRGIGQVAPLAVMPLASQPPENSGKFQDSYGQQRKRRRNSNNSRENSSPNQLMYMQQPVNFLSVAPSTTGASQGPNQIVAATPISLCTQYGQTSGSNNSIDGKTTPASVAAGKFQGLSDKDALTSVPSSENIVQGGEAKSSGAASQINESHELSQANGNKGPQLVTVPIGFCLPSVDNSKMSAAGNSGGVMSNGNASSGIRQCQSSAQAPATHSETKPLADSTDSRAAPEGSSIRAAAIAAGARIASPSDAASIIKAAQSKDAIHIRPGESLPNHLKPLAPRPPLSSHPAVTVPSSAHASSSSMHPGQDGYGDSRAAKVAIFGSSDGSDDDEYDDDEDSDDDDDEGLTGDEAGQE